jgi:hypothetical protein
MARTVIALVLLLTARVAFAGVEAVYNPGVNLYVRVNTSATASVAVALTEGSSGGVGFYSVSDSALVTAGLSTAGNYPFKVFLGATPSTTANDVAVASGVLYWSGSVELPQPVNVTMLSGDATAADNLEAYSDGTTPQPVDVAFVEGNTDVAGQLASFAQAALETLRLDELVFADSDIDGAAPPAVGSVFFELMTKTAGSFTFDQADDSLEAIRDRGDAAW